MELCEYCENVVTLQEKSWTLQPECKAAYARGSHRAGLVEDSRIRETEIKEMPALTTGVEVSF